ncbi:axoneme assembly [Trichomonas vaginalis G3]|uniref:axoneme assembly n=1 Tax=Trichomonas vaginalis (strain ATCC PRA-98 / G3) TaxID=412133 RepID=UPI0021E571F4|nr:axoneme assembly [Trichomonas vaginalis G3]KAI5489974.1 axoneme assembly [Trichomonas vaginalis G3]
MKIASPSLVASIDGNKSILGSQETQLLSTVRDELFSITHGGGIDFPPTSVESQGISLDKLRQQLEQLRLLVHQTKEIFSICETHILNLEDLVLKSHNIVMEITKGCDFKSAVHQSIRIYMLSTQN